MARVFIEQYEMNIDELKARYSKRAPRLVTCCEKYEGATIVVFQQDKIPLMVFVKTIINEGTLSMCCLTNVIANTFDVDIELLRRYKSSYLRKTNMVTFDFPRSVKVDGCKPSILRFTRIEEGEEEVTVYQPYSITQETFQKRGGFDWLDGAVQNISRGQEIHLICYTPAIEHTISRVLVEEHGFRQHRAIYIP